MRREAASPVLGMVGTEPAEIVRKPAHPQRDSFRRARSRALARRVRRPGAGPEARRGRTRPAVRGQCRLDAIPSPQARPHAVREGQAPGGAADDREGFPSKESLRMALRLVKPADGPAPAASSTPEPALAADSPIAALGARAGELLAAHDVRGYAELLEATAQREHVHGRYVARRILLERLLGAPGLPGHVLAEAYLAAARVTVDILHEEPREPVLLNTCGILLYELGAIAAAESLFRAAERLDPELPHLAGNLEECGRRRRDGGARLAGMPPAVLRELRTLGPKA